MSFPSEKCSYWKTYTVVFVQIWKAQLDGIGIAMAFPQKRYPVFTPVISHEASYSSTLWYIALWKLQTFSPITMAVEQNSWSNATCHFFKWIYGSLLEWRHVYKVYMKWIKPKRYQCWHWLWIGSSHSHVCICTTKVGHFYVFI